MIKKILLLFCCVNIFAVAAGWSAVPFKSTDDYMVFIDPWVSEKVIEKYFGHMIQNKIISANPSFWNDKLILSKALNTWNTCIKSNKDNLVSVNCVVGICKDTFGHAVGYKSGVDLFSKEKANNYCKAFVKELIDTQAVAQNPDCIYSVDKRNGSQMRIQYKTSDNTGFVRRGGSLAWRFFNPGNLRRSDLQCTRLDTSPSGTFAVFDSYETGRLALRTLLRGKGYSDLTIEQAISKYAPPTENNTASYIKNVKHTLNQHRGNVDTVKLRELNDSELVILMDAIERIEGWTITGEIMPI